MDEKRLMTMNIVSNLLNAYYTAKNSFCIVNQKEPELKEREELFKTVIRSFENLSTSYFKDIEDIAEGISK
ncbi:hypothetical protein BuS5_02840 [Desulfosarcina sp. BuS5]|uniref:hypothetical protein n=1 Tax=Desulfosarcina sp. BuS5 TaxID=933262 RepID=UPI00047F349F|nr:hypothetical protein [Desulfosarcina sp. BuS5]WDN89872.1 hypothetical protein BuS5_02840 [Desulfosarcina sp. BuS5]